ncbi:hypothetical protein [Brevundimonas sp.]|uniref:hypothetical protein n=1 Tax=Brevundimonas sp. TaxID=1871086 RepID=UPI00289A5B2E|nr:hypothetical protein [Brevundimonas sp.]
MTVLMAVAIALLLVLLLFSGRMPPKLRRVVETVLAVGYPAAVGLLFGLLGWTNYTAGDRTSALGFALGGAIMFILALRGWKRARKQP